MRARHAQRTGSCKIVRVARFEFKQDPPPGDWLERGNGMLSLVVRGFGVVLLVVGLVVALIVIVSAWSLYSDPTRIETFARAVEHGSNLDATLSMVAQHGQQQLDAGVRAGANDSVVAATAAAQAPPLSPTFRFSYFAAWFIAILLLLLNGRLAIAAVRTGGELALYDVQVKKLARALLKEQTRST